MSEKERNKAGLHKKISSIFSEVLIPQSDGDEKLSDATTQNDKEVTESKQQAPESGKSQSPKPYQTVEISTEHETAQESEAELAPETKDKPVSPPRFITAQESKVIPVEESEVEPAKETKDKSDSSPKSVAEEKSKVTPVEESEVEPSKESKDKAVSTPKFMTAQEFEVTPVEEMKAEPAKETKDKSDSSPKLVTDEKSKVIHVKESEVEPDQQSESAPANSPGLVTAEQSKTKETKKPKVIPVQKPKADSRKVIKKHTAVKVGEQRFWQQITEKLFTPKSGVSPIKQKATVIMVPVLFIILLIFVFKGGLFGTGVHNVEAGEQNTPSGVVPAASNNQIDWKIPEPYPTTLRDPMRLGPVKIADVQAGSGGLVNLSLKSILYSEDRSSAVIDNRIVHEGDKVRGVKIKKINEDNVQFEMNGKTWTQEVKG